MKIWEILIEDDNFDQDNDHVSDYSEDMKSELLNYLTTLSATGVRTKVPTQKIINFMKELGYDLTPGQVADMLDDTPFDANAEQVFIGSLEKTEKNKEKQQDNEKKVSNMAQKQIQREM